MRGATKKGKKAKGTVLSLNTFLGDAPQGTVNVVKKISSNTGEFSDDDERGNNSATTTAVIMQLPTAPKAQRVFDDDSIPHRPPFVVRISNLPFDANEDDVYELFGDIAIKSLTLPRDDGETGRLRGYGRVELENRDDLIHMLSLPEPNIRGRRIRIEMFNQTEHGMGNRMTSGRGDYGAGNDGNRRHYNNFGDTGANRESTNWRQDSTMMGDLPSTTSSSPPTTSSSVWRRNSPEASTSRSGWTPRSYRDDSNDNKDVGGNWRQARSETNTQAAAGGGGGVGASWRTSTQRGSENADYSAWRDNSDGNRRRNYGDRHGDSPSRDRIWQRRTSPTEEQGTRTILGDEERPRLKLLPRQLPLPKIITSGNEENVKQSEKSSSTEELKELEVNKANLTSSSSSANEADSGHDSDEGAVGEQAV